MAAKYPYGMCYIQIWGHKWDLKAENILDPLFLTGEEAESSFLESERLVEELHQRGDISQEDKIKTIQEVSSGLYRYDSNQQM